MWWCKSSFQTGNNAQCHWMVITTDIRIWCSQPFQTSSMPKKRLVLHYSSKGGGPGAVVKAACLESRRSRVQTTTLAFKFHKNKLFLPRSLVMIQYCLEPPWPRGGVLGLRPPGLEFRILCLEGSVIPFISPSSGGSPGPLLPIMCTKVA